MKTQNIFLISEEAIKDHSSIFKNVDPTVIKAHILESENIDLKYILPEKLYDEIFLQFDDYLIYIKGGGTDPISSKIDARILDLVDYAQPMLIYYTLQNAAFDLWGRITNKGVNTQNSQYSDSVSMNEIKTIREDWKNKAESYAQILIDFMAKNINIYPEFTTDTVGDNGPNYSSGLYLGNEI